MRPGQLFEFIRSDVKNMEHIRILTYSVQLGFWKRTLSDTYEEASPELCIMDDDDYRLVKYA